MGGRLDCGGSAFEEKNIENPPWPAHSFSQGRVSGAFADTEFIEHVEKAVMVLRDLTSTVNLGC
jgi:hypothetical protein